MMENEGNPADVAEDQAEAAPPSDKSPGQVVQDVAKGFNDLLGILNSQGNDAAGEQLSQIYSQFTDLVGSLSGESAPEAQPVAKGQVPVEAGGAEVVQKM